MQDIDKIIPVFGTTDFLNPEILKRGGPKKFVISGCARSGTQFIKLLLNSLDIDVGHERLYSDGIVSWKIPHWNQAVGIKDAFFEYDTIWIHLVRNPVEVITSILRLNADPNGRQSYQALLHQFPVLSENPKYQDPKLLGVQNWIRWNALIAAFFPITATIRVEDLKTSFGKFTFAKLIGKSCFAVSKAVDRLGERTHAFPKKWCDDMDKLIGEPFNMQWLQETDYESYILLKDAAETYGYFNL